MSVSPLSSFDTLKYPLFSSVQLLSCVRLFATPWTAACKASLSITNSRSLLKLMSIVLVIPSNHLILCHPLLLPHSICPASGSFSMSQFFASGGQSIGDSASASVLPMNIQDWLLLGLTGWISLQSRSDQIRSVTQLCPTLCDPMNLSTPGLPVHHKLPEFTQTHVHRVSDAIQPSHPLSSPSPPAPSPSQHQSLFQWVNSSHEVAKVLEFQL